MALAIIDKQLQKELDNLQRKREVKIMDEEKAEEKTEAKEEAVKPEETGDKPETTGLVDDTNLAAKRMEEATKAAKEERLEAEASYMKMKLGGKAEAGITKEPKRLTDDEYAEAVERGEVNPLKEDGFV